MQTVSVPITGRTYPIYVGNGTRVRLRGELQAFSGARTIVVIADKHVADLHWEALRAAGLEAAKLITFQPGEASKTLATAEHLYNELGSLRLSRADLIVTFGGGVAGDLGGFVAATWLRGIRYVQVPTTLEAAVDAAVGGKTAVNHPRGKNLIGAFHQPSAVIVDTDFLQTLSQRDLVAGLAESVKHALIRDPDFLDWHERKHAALRNREPAALTRLIARNCAIKADVVARDERESGLRAILNYGHTIGHAVEHLLGYELRHGECVGLGMVAENAIACARHGLDPALAARTESLLSTLGLPTRLPRALDTDAVVELCRGDKKARAGAIRMVLLQSVGHPQMVGNVLPEEIAAALDAIRPTGPVEAPPGGA